MNVATPRPEYPRPHQVRDRWQNLNGEWQFAFDDDDRGLSQGWCHDHDLPLRITVPFSFEAPLSGIDDRGIHPVIWYRRHCDITDDFLAHRLLLHIGASDYLTTVWVNGQFAGEHRGGYTPMTCEIQRLARRGANEVVVRVEDRPSWSQPRGKQIVGEKPVLIDYDRITGIWQSVWLEPAPDLFIEDCWSHFHLDGNRLVVHANGSRETMAALEVVLSLHGIEIARGQAWMQDRREGRVELSVVQPQLWSPDTPVLYDLTVRLRDGDGVLDEVRSYTGLREFTRSRRRVLLNGSPFYFRGVLDQGYFPGGWYTAASDDDLRRDIELMQAMGFNGARKHQKVEDPRWLYWADRLGFVVWGEIGNGRDFCATHLADLTREWLEVVRRDRMHPSIMAWVPLNESWGVDSVDRSAPQQQWVSGLYHLTHAADGSRLVIPNDGWQFVAGDVWGLHCYVPDAATLTKHLRHLLVQPTAEVIPGRQAALPGIDTAELPVMVTEFGGIAYSDPQRADRPSEAWGYETADDADRFAARLGELVDAVRALQECSGFVWTQLADVQQEVNGLLYFDRTPKLPLPRLRSIFTR